MSQAQAAAVDQLSCSHQLFKELSRRTSSSSEVPLVKENRRRAPPSITVSGRTARTGKSLDLQVRDGAERSIAFPDEQRHNLRFSSRASAPLRQSPRLS